LPENDRFGVRWQGGSRDTAFCAVNVTDNVKAAWRCASRRSPNGFGFTAVTQRDNDNSVAEIPIVPQGHLEISQPQRPNAPIHPKSRKGEIHLIFKKTRIGVFERVYPSLREFIRV
jgi:hypothetical protein